MKETPLTVDPVRADLELRVEELTEALSDAQRILAAEDTGWSRVGGDQMTGPGMAQLRKTATDASIMDPLIGRGIGLRTAYVWGEGVSVSGTCDDEAGSDMPDFVAAWLEDQAASWSGSQAREELERHLATAGNAFYALDTSPLTGRVEVRSLPVDEITEIITDPEDNASPWFYRRVWVEKTITGAGGVTRTATEQRTAFYPDVGHRPARRPRSIDGHEVRWWQPVAHVAVNRVDERSRWGVPDVVAALPWARGYRGFLGDWAGLMKALSKIAYQATAKSGVGGAQVRHRLASSTDEAGQTVVAPEGMRFEAVSKSGATIDANSGRPLAAMVAAGLDVPVTMLLSDPGVTGARATAETLDRPMELTFSLRREVHAEHIRAVVRHVVASAIRAPQGPLRGTVRRDPVTGRETVDLAGSGKWSIDIDWPDLATDPTDVVVSAVVSSVVEGLLDPLIGARLIAVALGVDDVARAVEMLTGTDGQYLDPRVTAGQAAADAARRVLDAGGSEDDPIR